MYLSQTKQQEHKDQEVLAEAKKIAESHMPAKVAEDSELAVVSNGGEATERVDPGDTPSNIQLQSRGLPSTSATDNTAILASLRMVNLKPRVQTIAVCAEHLELRKEILTLLNLQKQLQYKEAEGSSFRDGSYTETPGTPKDRTLILDSMNFGGERAGKRDQKHKSHLADYWKPHSRRLSLKDLEN